MFDRHIIIGVPKAIVAFGLFSVFDIKKLSIAVFDNADVTVSSDLVQQNIIRHLSSQCQKIYLSCTKMPTKPNMRNVVEKNMLIDNVKFPQHLESYFIRCVSDGAKMDVLRAICLKAYDATVGKVLVFFSVSIIYTV